MQGKGLAPKLLKTSLAPKMLEISIDLKIADKKLRNILPIDLFLIGFENNNNKIVD